MNRSAWVVGIASALIAIEGRDAQACGGCFHPPIPPTQVASDITDERMLLSVSSTQTTLYDQIRYAGSPSSFAWVLPIRGTVTVGLSADVLFDAVDALTATEIKPPPSSCPPPPQCGGNGGCFGGANSNSASGFANAGGPPPVTVTKQQNVGPYATVQLHASDSGALDRWLTDNGFVIPDDVTPVLEAYIAEGFDFLAMKLLPDQGVQAMRPVRVTSAGAGFSLPLRMAAIGTGTTVGITIWVVSDGRYEPQNFPFFHIDDSALVWDWTTSLSNYTTLRTQQEAAQANKAWEIESSIDVNEQIITTAIVSGGQSLGTVAGQAADPGEDYLPVTTTPPGTADAGDAGTSSPLGDAADDEAGDSASDAGAASDADEDAGDSAAEGSTSNDGGVEASAGLDAGTGAGMGAGLDAGMSAADAGSAVVMTAEQVRTADIAALFAGLPGPTVRITRIRSDIAHAAMTADLVLQASSDQSELSNVRLVKQSVNETCSIYDGCSVVGTGTPAEATAKSKSGGCAATPGIVASWSSGSGVFAGLLGLVLARAVQSRRRRSRSKG